MTTIWKMFKKLDELDDWIEFSLPVGAKVLSVGNQREQLCLWFEVNTTKDLPKTRHYFRTAGTGHPVNVPHPIDAVKVGRFVGTVFFSDGELVFHVYEGEL